MKLRTLLSLWAPVLLLAGCDRPAHEAERPEPPSSVVEPSAVPARAPSPEPGVSETPPDTPPGPAESRSKPPGEPYRVGGSVTRPEVIHRVAPDFAALRNGEVRSGGAFIAEAVVDEKGNVTSARTLRSSGPKFDAAALAALRQWKFKPATFNGKPVAVYYTLTMNIQWQ